MRSLLLILVVKVSSATVIEIRNHKNILKVSFFRFLQFFYLQEISFSFLMKDSGEEDLYKEWMSHGNYSVVEKILVERL